MSNIDHPKNNPEPGPGIAHDFDCTHDPCACGETRCDQLGRSLTEIAETNIGKSSVGRRMRDRARAALANNGSIKIMRDGEAVNVPLSTRQREQIAALAPYLLDEIVSDMFVEDLRAAAKTLRGGLNVGATAMAGGNAKEQTQRACRLDYMADKIEASR